MRNILERMKRERLYFDGGTGTVLQKRGLGRAEPPEKMNIKNRAAVLELHLEYLRAGADIIKTNTFGINSLKYDDYKEQLRVAVDIAKEAVDLFDKEAYVAFDVGPTGRMLKPFGDLAFEDAISIFSDNMRLASELGADLILVETMSDICEMKAAVIAAKENSDLPVFVTCAFGNDGKLLTGGDVGAVVALLEGMGVDAIGLNCSHGPQQMLGVFARFAELCSTPIIVNPNAGLPKTVNGEAVYDLSAEEYANIMLKMCEMGASIVGGCCGTTPEHIKCLRKLTENLPYRLPTQKKVTLVSSYTHSIEIGNEPKIIGERINPTGKPRLKSALRSGDLSYILSIALEQEARGAHILDVNAGLADIDEKAVMLGLIGELQAVSDLPLQIDSGRADVMEAAVRKYCGKPLINSVNGSLDSMNSIFPIVKKYGGTVIALTMDDDGIPVDAAGRVKIAEKIIEKAREYGIDEKEIVFDPLVLTVASNSDNARITLEAVRALKKKGYKCSLGISNVSFGLPERDVLNSAFYTAALCEGLDLAIINPDSAAMMNAYRSYMTLSGRDAACSDYISHVEGLVKTETVKSDVERTLSYCIEKGLRDEASAIAGELINKMQGIDIINGEIIPALNRVGVGFETGRVYLPGLLMSAEAANAAFSVIKENAPKENASPLKKLVLATVKGDIHDIGKNIVKLIFESYGYTVIDLGRDVGSARILEALRESGADLLGLSALMTTTLPAMEETVALVRRELPAVRIMVGGAVVTETYAKKIGADFYAPDALRAIKFAET